MIVLKEEQEPDALPHRLIIEEGRLKYQTYMMGGWETLDIMDCAPRVMRWLKNAFGVGT